MGGRHLSEPRVCTTHQLRDAYQCRRAGRGSRSLRKLIPRSARHSSASFAGAIGTAESRGQELVGCRSFACLSSAADKHRATVRHTASQVLGVSPDRCGRRRCRDLEQGWLEFKVRVWSGSESAEGQDEGHHLAVAGGVDAVGGGRVRALHGIVRRAPLGAQLLGQRLVACQVRLGCLWNTQGTI